MAPFVPEEINVFSVPHSRMKELVNSYFDLIQSINFSSTVDLEMLLESLYSTFTEFKSHEQIENKLIVRKLRTKMRMLSVNNPAVCNCHKGSRLSEMLRLLEDGFSKITDQDRINYGIKLQKELMEFTNDSFLPHMKEEEELFQPLLLKYFSYKELCSLKQKVIQQHLDKKEARGKGLEKAAWADLETEEGCCDSTASESEEEEVRSCVESWHHPHVTVKLSIVDLPPELILKVFQYLSPRELCRCALLCHRLNRLAMDRSLWKTILPVQWAKGNFSFFQVYSGDSNLESSGSKDDEADEDADIDESEDRSLKTSKGLVFSELKVVSAVVTYLLPKVGRAVEKLVLANGRKITDKLVRKLLILCPNVKYIDLSQTNISDAALVSFGRKGFASELSALILSGCSKITDASLIRLALCLRRAKDCPAEDFEDFSTRCLAFCDQYLEACQSQVGQRCVDENKCQLKLLRESVMGLDESLANCSRGVKGPCGGPKRIASCDIMDSCELFKVQCDAMSRQLKPAKSLTGDGVQGRPAVSRSRSNERTLETLDLSGCILITDAGLSALFRRGRFPHLTYLDLSGCMRLTAVGLNDAVAASPSLEPCNLFYCDNIIDGPYADEASGCQNLECSQRACCRSGN